MKKTLLLLSAATALSATAVNPPKQIAGYLRIIPAPLTIERKSIIVTEEGDANTLTAYDSDLNSIASISIPEPQEIECTYWNQYRKYLPVLVDTEITDDVLSIDGKEIGLTVEDILKRWSHYDAVEVNGETLIVRYYYHEYEYGKEYIDEFYKLIEGRWILCYNSYETKRVGDWEEATSYTRTGYTGELISIEFSDEGNYGMHIDLTQNFFNTDNQFEYVTRNYKKSEYSNDEADGSRSWGEELILAGYSIMNQNGTKLFDIEIPSEYKLNRSEDVFTCILDGKKYFCVEFTDASWKHFQLFYELDGKGGVKAPKIVKGSLSVSPAMPRHGETVNVDLGEEAANATSISVVSTNGSTVFTLPVSAGQRNVELRTSGLASGLYIITANGREAAKIIIR